MKRLPRMPLIIAGVIGVFLVALAIAGLAILQTNWFHNYVRTRIIETVQTATGGRAEIGAFSFSPRSLRAEADNFVLHGTEPEGRPPLFRARSIVVGLKILSVLHRKVDIQFLDVNEPQAVVTVAPDGTTNLPSPKVPRPDSGKDVVQTLLDLAVGRFTVNNGLAVVNDNRTPLNARGENLTARFVYHSVTPGYTGNISISPLFVDSAGSSLPVNVSVPLEISGNGIRTENAAISTPKSQLQIAAELANAVAARGSFRAKGRLGLEELARTFDPDYAKQARNAADADVEVDANFDQGRLDLTKLAVRTAGSNLDASGTISNIQRMDGTFQFRSGIDLAKVGRILEVQGRPQGAVQTAGVVKLSGLPNYAVTAQLSARDVAFQAGETRVSNVEAVSHIEANPKLVRMTGIRVAALGGRFDGNARIEQMARFQLDGSIQDFGLRHLARTYASPKFVWDGAISGPVHLAGSFDQPVARRLIASAQLAIDPRQGGVPVSGRLLVNYNGPRDTIDLGNSFVALPNSRVDFAGSIGNQLKVRLASKNLDDFLPALAMASSDAPQKLPIDRKSVV